MNERKVYSCDALNLGRHIVHGSLSSSYLSGLISRSQRAQVKPIREENKCTVEIGESGFSVHFIRKDEGFESDGESSASSLSDKVERLEHKKHWNKGDKDRPIKGKDPDDTSSANSSGSEHEEHDPLSLPKQERSNYDRVRETYPMSDILFCHGTKKYPNCIVFVIRHKAVSRSVQLEALVFQCKNEESLRELWNAYSDCSRTLKLDKYRQNRRRTVGSDVKHSTVTVNNIVVPANKLQEKPIKYHESSRSQSPNREPERKWSLVQHTDKNGVTHIEIEGSCSSRVVMHEESSETDSIISFNTPETDAPTSLTFVPDSDKKKGHSSRQRQVNVTDVARTPSPPSQRRLGHRRCESEGSVKPIPPPQPPPRKQKGPAPSPPASNSSKPKVYLVPTKSGTEPKKTLYPKESHVVRGKYVRINVMTNNYSPYGYGMFNSRYVDINDMNNNNHGVWRGRYWSPSAEMHHTGRRGRELAPPQEIRRRSRSKSPPRKPMAHRYIDVSMPSFTGFSQKFKELSESVMPKKFRSTSDNVTTYTKYMKTDFEDETDMNMNSDKYESNIIVVSDTSNAEKVIPILKKIKPGRHSPLNPTKKQLTFSEYSSVQVIDPV